MRINNISFFFIFVLIVSCSDLKTVTSKTEGALDDDLVITEASRWVYCTENDKINDKKTFDANDDELCLRKKLKIGSYVIHLKSTILNSSADGADEIGYNELIIKNKKKIIKKMKLEKKGDPFYFITGFAKIRKGVYQTDLNEDGIMEFALVNYGTDRNRFTRAKIYSLHPNGKLKLYGMGTYNKDLAENVWFGCPDCHTINIDACKSCY